MTNDNKNRDVLIRGIVSTMFLVTLEIITAEHTVIARDLLIVSTIITMAAATYASMNRKE
jgi:hypothetical protein